jgi:hypothetical protein
MKTVTGIIDTVKNAIKKFARRYVFAFYQQEYEIDIPDDFTISDSAVKKQARIFKSVIKLDKNFHIYVHVNGDRRSIRLKGYDYSQGGLYCKSHKIHYICARQDRMFSYYLFLKLLYKITKILL